MVLDDTQALGIFGHSPTVAMPYGSGGGGSLCANRLAGAPVILVSSLAKGFGVPMAMVAGSFNHVVRFEARSTTQIHSSPPSFADLHAAASALKLNRKSGDATRARLMILILRFRAGLRAAGIQLGSSLFPVQSLRLASNIDVMALHWRLQRIGVNAVLHRPACIPRAMLSFIITAHHTPDAIDHAVAATVWLSTQSRRFLSPGGLRIITGCAHSSTSAFCLPAMRNQATIIDSHCHAGKGDGLTGPWDTNASLDSYLRRAYESRYCANSSAAGVSFELP